MCKLVIADEGYVEYLEDIVEGTNLEKVVANIRYFPNGELLVRVPEVEKIRGRKVAPFFPTFPETNNRIFALFQLIDILSEHGGENITLIMPYLSYSRQDKRFLKGECISLKLLLDILYHLGVNTLVAFDVHNPDVIPKYSKIKFINIQLGSSLVKYIINNYTGYDVVLISPDEGRWRNISKIASEIGIESTYLIKERDRYTGSIEIKGFGKEISLDNRSVILLDDEISTGGTMVKAISFIRENAGVGDIYVAATHLLLINNADKKILDSGATEIVGSNTVRNKYGKVKIEPYIRRLLLEEES